MVREEPKKAQKRSGRSPKRLRNGPGGAQKLSGRSPKKGSEMVRLAESPEMVREEPCLAGVLSRGALVGVPWWRGGSSGCSGGVFPNYDAETGLTRPIGLCLGLPLVFGPATVLGPHEVWEAWPKEAS